MPERRAQTLRNTHQRSRSSAAEEKSHVARGRVQKANSHRRSYGPQSRRVSRPLKRKIIRLKVAIGSTARRSYNSLYLRPKLSDQSPQSTSQDVRDHVVGALSSTSVELISSVGDGRAIAADGRELAPANAPDISSRSVGGNDSGRATHHDLSFSCTSSLLLKPWETASKELVSKVNGVELFEETRTLSVNAPNAMAERTQGFEAHSEEIDPAVEVIPGTSRGFAAIRPEQCELPRWNSPHRGPSVDMGRYNSTHALPSTSIDKQLADIMIPMSSEGSTLLTSHELAGSGPVNVIQSIRIAGHSDPHQLKPPNLTNCVFPTFHPLLPGLVPAKATSTLDHIAPSSPIVRAIDTIDGVPLANIPLAPPPSMACAGNLRDDDDVGSGFFQSLLDKSTSSRASTHRNGINCRPDATMWSSGGPCHVDQQHRHHDVKQASSDKPSRAISISKHVTDLPLVYPRRGTSLPDLAWLPPLARTAVEMATLTSPHSLESRGTHFASTSRDSRNFHPSSSISTSSSASLLSPLLFFFSLCYLQQ